MRTDSSWRFALLLAFSVAGFAQEAGAPDAQTGGGWRKFGEPVGSPSAPAAPPADPLPPGAQFVVPAGTWITVRVDEPLSSDRNQPGDAFTATLAQPIVANGRVIARRGQTVSGAVSEAQKAGHVQGTSRLGIELTELSLVDGRQVPIHTRMMERRGDTSVGNDVAAIGTTTAIGAAIGAAADGGFGAGMGAIAGAGASIIGVLATRGKPTVIYPENLVTFRLENPVTVDAGTYQEAFQPVNQQDYEPQNMHRQGPPRPAPYYGGYPPYPPPYYGGYPPYGYGPSVVIFTGHRGYRGYRRW